MTPDRYRNFHHLSQHHREAKDFEVLVRPVLGHYAIVAPHGGGIEQGTSELAIAIAGQEHALYCFNGLLEADNEWLHLTSTRFDEPRCLDLIAQVQTVVTIHGVLGRESMVHLGGLDSPLLERILFELRGADFPASVTDDPGIAGARRANLCNGGLSGRGCQLEISKGLRRQMFAGLNRTGRKVTTPVFDRFVAAIRRALIP